MLIFFKAYLRKGLEAWKAVIELSVRIYGAIW